VIHSERIIALAARHRLPAVYFCRFFVREGGLISYSARRADDNPRSLEAELPRLLAEQKVLQQRLQAEQSVLTACKTWVDRLPADTRLEPVAVTADGHDLAGVRKRIKAANTELEALRCAPAPSEDIEARVREYVRGLAPKGRGIGVGERLSIVWPGAQTPSWYISEHTCDPLALVAALFPDRMLSLVMAEVERMANDPLPVAQRAPRLRRSGRHCHREHAPAQ